jgi:hypothetical protein
MVLGSVGDFRHVEVEQAHAAALPRNGVADDDYDRGERPPWHGRGEQRGGEKGLPDTLLISCGIALLTRRGRLRPGRSARAIMVGWRQINQLDVAVEQQRVDVYVN